MHTQPFAPQAPIAPPIYELSGWWRRVGASMIDNTLVTISMIFIDIPFDLAFDTGVVLPSSDAFQWQWQLLGAVLGIVSTLLWVVLLMKMTNGRTIGKMATGIRVVRTDGAPITFGYAFTREYLVKGVLFGYFAIFTLFVATLLNSLWPLWDEQHRALHDMMMNSRVVLASSAPQPPQYAPAGRQAPDLPFPYAPPAPPPIDPPPPVA